MLTDDQVQIVIFEVGPQEFGVDIFQVERILRWQEPTRLPRAPAFLEGVIPYGEGVVPLVDLRRRLEMPAPHTDETRLVVLQLDDHRVAVTVDRVVEVARVDSTAISAPPPMVRGLAAEYIAGILPRGKRTVLLLHANRLLNSEERLALADGLEPVAGAAPGEAGQ